MKSQRPVNLDLRTIWFPITAITSILHRISGVVLFLVIPLVLYWWESSLSSKESFNETASWFTSPFGKLFAYFLLLGLFYHLVAGVRHLLMDIGIGESLETARLGSKAVIAITLLVGVWLGVLIW